jgi:TonB-linked SusC/RagA family outer membrane protein
MKKNKFLVPLYRNWKKLLLTMKLCLLLLLISAASLMANNGYSQNTLLSVHLKNATLRDLISEVEKQSEFIFVFYDNVVDLDRQIDVESDNQTINEILDKIFKSSELTYRIFDRQIGIGKRDPVTGVLNLPVSLVELTSADKKVSGVVKDTKGQPLPGVTVVVKGTSIGTVTNAEGNFTLTTPTDAKILQFSFIGLVTQEVPMAGKNVMSIVLEEQTVSVDEVVVTAFGMEKSAKTLSYSTQKLGGDELTKVINPNLMNSLSGKMAGVSINQSTGVGSSVKVIIRGNKSIQRNNQPLYVVDGVPVANSSGQTTNGLISSYDNGGDGISNLDPEDIESISVLKGAGAAALYGSQAANGVILVTTKKGKAGVTKIDFSSSITMDKIISLPQLQHSWGQTAPGAGDSWGPKLSSEAPDNLTNFFNTGTSNINSISLSSGNEKMQTYLSYSNTNSKGVEEGNKLIRNNFYLRQSAKFFNDKLTVDGSVTLVDQKISNPPVSGNQQSIYYATAIIPVGLNLADYKNYEVLDPNRNVMTQSWFMVPTANSQNPYWIINRMLREYDRTRAILRLSLRYDLTKWMNLQVRGNLDDSYTTNEFKNFYGTVPAYGYTSGYYRINKSENPQMYGDALLNIFHHFGKIKLHAMLGTSISDSRRNGVNIASSVLKIPNVFTLQNMQLQGGTGLSTSSLSHEQLQSVFGSANLTYNDWLVLDVTGRNDWSSNLSFTPNVSYFYPSFGLTGLIHEFVSLPKVISFAKIRGSYAIVGNTVPIYVTNPSDGSIGGGSVINFNDITPFTDLEPEKTGSLELGANMRFFNDRLSLDFSYYKTNTLNQFFTVQVPPGTGYNYRYVNGGDIQNSGVEIMAEYSLSKKDFRWDSFINFSKNKNVVKELAAGFDQYVITSDLSDYNNILKVGGSYGDLYGQSLKRDDQGRIIISSSGSPILSGANDFLGSSYPDFKLAWNNNLTYKNFSLSFLIDGSFGGKLMSLTQMYLDMAGVSQATGLARDNGSVKINGVLDGIGTQVTEVDPRKWFIAVSQYGVGEYMYDATVLKLRELTLGYSLPTKRLNMGFIKNLKLSLIGHNLFYIYKPAPYDSDITYTTGNGYSGVDVFNLPASRSLGICLNVTF